jgi:hypothetical protein
MTVDWHSLFAFSDRPDTIATRRDDMLLSVAVAAINRRLFRQRRQMMQQGTERDAESAIQEI